MPWREARPDDGEPYAMGCHLWTGHTDPHGVPVVRTATSQTTAARAAWERENGPVPPGKVVAKLCGTKLCVNPRHLEPMTWEQIRYRTGMTKLDAAAQRRALALRMRGLSGRRIAKMLGVDEGVIRRVLRGDYYRPGHG